ncbi:MAG: type II toxin-antitoxin system VapC family toxin [Chloroflexi bacterium]|nr:type II toxin-antitoxin system VapC family toxin [Chloroflexota bacterium]
MTNDRRFGRGRAFVDTSAYYALTDPRDGNHAPAHAIAARLATTRWQIITTNFILAETHALLLARLGRAIALRTLDAIERGATTIVRVSADDERRARAILRQYEDKDFTLTDALSFAVMERLALAYAFTFDRHFAQYGFAVLTPHG